MKVLADTSVWIEFYHPRGSSAVKQALREALESHEVAVVAPIIGELLVGAKDERTLKRLQEDMGALSILPLGGEEGMTAGVLGGALARAGRRVPTVDLLVAAAAHGHGFEVWHYGDEHYALIASSGGPPQRNLKG